MDSRLVRIFCANLPSQKTRGASYNLLLLLGKDCLFCHRSECYGPPSPSISLESIKSQTGNRDLATTFLGTPHSERSRLCRALRLYPLQSRETWIGRSPISMVLFHISSLRRARSLSDALGRIGTEHSANNGQRVGWAVPTEKHSNKVGVPLFAPPCGMPAC